MKNLLESWENLAQEWSGKRIILFLDYDGTLSPIAENPAQAVLSQENRELIERLVKIPHYQVVIISGRVLSDVKQKVGVEGVLYVGNHGWEIEGSSMHFENLISLEVSAIIQRIKYELMTQLSDIPGAFVEDKGVTLSVHYRLVAKDKEFLVRRIFENICMPYDRQKLVRIQKGKKVFELRPQVAWDKGKVALWLLRKQELLKGKGNVIPVYIGDDSTDEDAFEALHDLGITVFVGKPEDSKAQYFLAGPQEVSEVLKHMVYGAYEKL